MKKTLLGFIAVAFASLSVGANALTVEQAQKALPHAQVQKVNKLTGMNEIFEIQTKNGHVLYLSKDAKTVFTGDQVDLVAMKNVTHEVKKSIKKPESEDLNWSWK
ncbi:MAG: hypothetical protein IBX55_00315 [Methyloprofundus sp.]|nr:hypothetical protein [Methyloprofundus sp.]